MTTFDSTKESLLDLLQSIKQGKTQLPDFQRGWVWDDDHIRSLLASVSLSFPIGAVMMLQTGNPDVRFKPRLVEGLAIGAPPEPERLILDVSRDSRRCSWPCFAGHRSPLTTAGTTPSSDGTTSTSPRRSVPTATAKTQSSAFPRTAKSGTSAAR